MSSAMFPLLGSLKKFFMEYKTPPMHILSKSQVNPYIGNLAKYIAATKN